MQDELVESIRRFSTSDDPLSTATAQTFVDAFAPLSHATALERDAPTSSQAANLAIRKARQARSTAVLTLVSRSSSSNASIADQKVKHGTSERGAVDENLPQLLTPVIRSRLADTTPYSLLSALHFFSALFSVLPAEAHDVLVADGIIDLVLEAPDACNAVSRIDSPDKASEQLPSDEDLVTLAVAELLSSAANSTATRKYLASQQAVLDWIDMASVSRNPRSSGPLPSPRKTDAIAVAAGLADIKIYRAIAAEAAEGLAQAASSQPTSQEDQIRRLQQSREERRHKDDLIYQVAQQELSQAACQVSSSMSASAVEHAAQAELKRGIQLSSLEVLAYLTVQPAFKERVAADRELLQALCTGFDLSPPKGIDASQSVNVESQRFDGALHLSLATILANVTAYPPALTDEEKQVRRLRNFANAQSIKQGGDQPDEDEELESVPRVEKRCTAILEAKGVEALAAIAVAGPPPSASQSEKQDSTSWRINPSQSVRRACGEALLALITKQDRIARGKAVQQGALKTALALAAPVLQILASSATPSSTSQQGLFSRTKQASKVCAEDLAPLQALAKLLISLNPSVLFPSTEGLLSVAPCICSLLLCESASRLQRFEALLALTNLASVSPQVGQRIAAFSLDHPTESGGEKKNDAVAFVNTSVVAQAGEQLLMEEHTMVRRAWLELLVNLLQVQPVYKFFVSTSSTGDSQGRLTMRLRMLLGLSEVDDWAFNQLSDDGAGQSSKEYTKDHGGEASLATRMSCLAILAMVTEASAVVDALLSLDRLFPVLLSNLTLDRSDDAGRNQRERADLKPANADQKRPDVEIDAHVQLNAINLSMRASYVLSNVLQHMQAYPATFQPRAGGFDQASVQSTLQDVLSHHVAQLKKGAEPAHVEEARRALLQVMAECLKLLRQLKHS